MRLNTNEMKKLRQLARTDLILQAKLEQDRKYQPGQPFTACLGFPKIGFRMLVTALLRTKMIMYRAFS